MDSKKTQKLSKATVATVLAASGVVVAMPQLTSAKTFTDVSSASDFYEPIMNLANRNIIAGYPDGTFKPTKAVTRAEAAKLLASALGLNINNVKNPGFKDVKTTNFYYKYIAALAEQGIINGFPDNNYKPDEYITREQMAKIITLGYQFGISSNLSHDFKDVLDTSIFAPYIQTLLDLNITKGRSPISFAPHNTVTRGELATFIYRSENADKGQPLYTVGDVSDTQVYINGVAYAIAPALRDIFNEKNKNILKGAYVEGSFTSSTLRTVTKLTINASGTSTKLLALDGNYSTFTGELIVNGSYLRFRNIDFTGQVELAETPRRSLAVLQNIRIASTSGFIDWTKPTDPEDEDFLNPEENENLTDKPGSSTNPKPYTARMSNIQKYVDFTNAEIGKMLITQDRTFVSSNYDIDRLTIQRDVSNVELYADVTAMYIDTDVNLTMYGVNDAKYVYKNTLKNIFFNTNSMYEYYYVTTGSGFTNIGEHVYINNAIIPPGKTVNDIFDDYENDDSSIGVIEDEDGKTVDRDPVEDTVIKDITPPKILDLKVSPGGTVADVTLTANEDGTYYYIVQEKSEKAPTINEIKTGGKRYSGNGQLKMDVPVNFRVNDLESLKEYTIYVIVIDGAENVSNKDSVSFKTVDSTPPTVILSKGAEMPGGKRLQFKIKPSEPGEYYYYIREKTTAAAPTVDDIIKSHTGSGKATDVKEITVTARQAGVKPNALVDLKPNTEYEVFVAMVDLSGNKLRGDAPKLSMKTTAPDNEAPYVKPDSNGLPLLRLVDREKGIFEFDVNEALDPTTATDVNNYILSGTGIINITGQKETKPTKVELSGKTVRLTIPAVTALVNGDTIRVTVSKNVLDLAENEFENALTNNLPTGNVPRNYAEFKYDDTLSPDVKIVKVLTNQDATKYEVELNTNKAGTYYYMILPENYDFTGKGISKRDFVDEFSLIAGVPTGKFQTGSSNDYLLKGENTATVGQIKFDISKPANLDPFTSYSLYVVLKDRSGQLTEIVDQQLIADTKPPLVSGLNIASINNIDTAVNLQLNINEKSEVFALPIKKYIIDPVTGNRIINSTYFDASGNLKDLTTVLNTTTAAANLKALYLTAGAYKVGDATGAGLFDFVIGGANSTSGTNLGNVSKKLDPHEEYGVYIAVEDTFGNFTILQQSSSTANSNDEPSGPQMKKVFYTDGTKPYIANDGIIVREGQITDTNPKFKITFSEAIMRQNDVAGLTNYNKPGTFNLSDILTIKDASGVDITGDYVIDGTYGSTITDTTISSQLVIKLVSPNLSNAQRTFTVEMKDKTATVYGYDYNNANGFDTTKIGKYVYPATIGNKIRDAVITGTNIGTVLVPASKTMNAVVYLDIDLTVNQTYYYAVTDGLNVSVDPQKVIALVNDSNTPNNNILTYGSGVIDATNAANKQFTLGLTAPAAVGLSNPVFTKDNNLFLFTVDKYGNIVWAKDEGSTNNYRPIQ